MKNRVAVLFVAVAATGCVTEPPVESGPGPGAAPAVAVPATRIIEPEIEVVAVPTPLPLPGQLKPVASAQADAPEGAGVDPVQRVQAANAVARLEPAADGYVNAIQVFPWTEGALYQVYTAPGQVTDLAWPRASSWYRCRPGTPFGGRSRKPRAAAGTDCARTCW